MAELNEQEWSLWRSFHAMRQELDRTLEDRLQRDAGISDASYTVLVALTDSPERQLRSRELAANIGWEKSRLSHQVTRMVANGLVERLDCDDDLRGSWVRATSEGRRAMLRATRVHGTMLRPLLFDALSPQELTALRSASLKVLAAIRRLS
jgi:DNA-binding MarR family transcriptional regulator